MTRRARQLAAASIAALIAVAAIIAAPAPAQAQSDEQSSGKIIARRIADDRIEFGWQTPSGARVFPRQRYFPADATVGRWLRSSPVEVDGAAIGRINARLRVGGRIEFAFTPTDGERILPPSRYFPHNARIGRWLSSTTITISTPAPTPTTSGYTAVSAGNVHTCAIRAGSGAIECWGDNQEGESDAPAGSFTAIAAGSAHTCAIRDDRTIECWGWNDEGESDAPSGSFTAVSVSWSNACAIRTSGEFACWGLNKYGMNDAPSGSFTAVSVSWSNACAIRTSGEFACWGLNKYGMNDAPSGSFTAVSAGLTHICAIRAGSGAIECWGQNGYSGYDPDTNETQFFETGQTDAPAGRYTAVSAGQNHTCAIRAGSGAIECWGSDTNGYGRYVGQSTPPPGSYSAVSAGHYHTCAIRDDGAIECWGDHYSPPEGRFTAVSDGQAHTCAIRAGSGAIECWGWNPRGQATPPSDRVSAAQVPAQRRARPCAIELD